MALDPSCIEWTSHLDLEAIIKRSEQACCSVLLDFHDPNCAGCELLERSTYSNAAVINAVSQFTIPVRVITTSPDRRAEEIISRYIAISTPTVQLLSLRGTVDHCFRGAPRHTRLALSQWNRERNSRNGNYRRVYHEAVGCLPPALFLAELSVGRAKAALNRERFQEAAQIFQKVLADCASDSTVAEARYWSSVIAARATERPVFASGA